MGCIISKSSPAMTITRAGYGQGRDDWAQPAAGGTPSPSMRGDFPSTSGGARAPGGTGESMRPRTAVLHWPDGKKATGQMVCEDGMAPAFFANGVRGPLKDRCERHPEMASLRPGPLEVELAPTSARGKRAHVTPRLMEQVSGMDAAMLRSIADVAGGSNVGIDADEEVVLSNVMRSAVRQIAATCIDPDAVGRTIRALERPFVLFSFAAIGEDDRYVSRGAAFTPQGAPHLAETLVQLERGEHVLVRIALDRNAPGIEPDGHRLNMTATRQSDDTVQLSVINSNGWPVVARDRGFARAPGIAKTVSIDHACEALESLHRRAFEPTRDYRAQWHRLDAGAPLYTWLRDEVEPDSRIDVTRQRARPQKQPDCAIEVEFAWLASVLHKADYKLVKAHVLNTFLQAAVANGSPPAVVQRLRNRLTSSLSARAMESGR